MKSKLIFIIAMATFSLGFFWFGESVMAESDTFPPREEAPLCTTYFADGISNNIYYCSPSGNNSTGNGTISNPWFDLRGAQEIAQAGDLILFRGGTYSGIENGRSWFSLNRLTTTGTADDYIVIKNYPGETPVFDNIGYFSMTLYSYQVLDGISFRGGISIYNPEIIVQNCDFREGTAGQRDGNPGMIIFPAESPYASNITIINNSFHDNRGDHVNGHGRSYAMCMFESNLNGGYTKILYNKFYNFIGATSQKYILYCKDFAHGLEIAYNRFYNSNAYALGGWGQGDDNIVNYDIHHNLVYNCDGLGIYWGEAVYAKWRSNVVIDDGYLYVPYYTSNDAGESMALTAYFNDHGSNNVWGEVYDNVFYVDYPGEFFYSNVENTGYWEWVDYNAYADTIYQGRFENAKKSSSNWQGNDILIANTITVDENYFATIPDDSLLRNAGRYGGNIGGFEWGGQCSGYNNNQTACELNSCSYCDGTCQAEACSMVIRADVDQNSSINTTDAMLTLRNSLGLDMLGINWQTSDTTGDVNCDGDSNSTDAMLILRYSLGLGVSGTGWCE